MSAERVWRVERVAAPVTYPLRQRVLRPHQSLEQFRFPGEDDPEVGHFAVFAPGTDGMVIGVVIVLRESPPPMPDADPAGSWRLRAMATAEDYRRRGVGSALVNAVMTYVAATGGTVLWCHARVSAVEFYRTVGFEPIGDPWEEPLIGEHITMWRTVPPAG